MIRECISSSRRAQHSPSRSPPANYMEWRGRHSLGCCIGNKAACLPNQLPSGTNVYFLILIITSFMISFWSGQFLPGLDYFTTPFNSPIQPGLHYTRNGLYGVGICFLLSCYLFIYHTRRQQRAFGSTDVLTPDDPVWEKVHTLSKEMNVGLPKLLLDRDIRNADAIAFGYLTLSEVPSRTYRFPVARGVLEG
jgi:hypothetical protein